MHVVIVRVRLILGNIILKGAYFITSKIWVQITQLSTFYAFHIKNWVKHSHSLALVEQVLLKLAEQV